MNTQKQRPEGLVAIDKEMARQFSDALISFENNRELAEKIAGSLRKTGKLLLLGMGGSHAVGRAVEPLYRAHNIDAVAIPISEQLGAALPIDGKTVLVTSQSGESAEVVRWFVEKKGQADIFGLTLDAGSFLASKVDCLVGHGGGELAFAATRILTISFALHLAILAALGDDPRAALNVLNSPQTVAIDTALDCIADVNTIVTSGRSLQGVAEAIALGFTELSRVPSYSLEGGQLRHGPLEMLSPKGAVILFKGNDATAPLVTAMGQSVAETGAKLVVFDASGEAPVPGAVTISFPAASGLGAVFTILPTAQRLMMAFADQRVENAGTPVRSSKITRSE